MEVMVILAREWLCGVGVVISSGVRPEEWLCVVCGVVMSHYSHS